jgi:thiol:disulfide interchange protein
MKNRLYWIAVGGLSFWLPAMVVAAAFHEDLNLWALNVIPLAGLTLLGAASWIATNHLPKWGWVLAGIYILGPVSMVAPSVFLHVPSSPNVPGENIWMFLFCVFPPMTLWMAVLNGMIFSVLIATVTLPFLAAYLGDRG